MINQWLISFLSDSSIVAGCFCQSKKGKIRFWSKKRSENVVFYRGKQNFPQKDFLCFGETAVSTIIFRHEVQIRIEGIVCYNFGKR
ncbi:hypothetical protein CU633_17150 [Bacillus sp. V3-13]|nr:hypothetical protein CU633_17150 [Bacillus sp. V3-13]